MSDIINFTPAYLPVLIIGALLLLVFAVIDFVVYRIAKKKGKSLQTWMAILIVVSQSLLIAGAAVLLGVLTNENMNRGAVEEALTEAEIALTDEQFQQLRDGEVIVVEDTYIALTGLDDAGLKYELNAVPVTPDEADLSLEEILNPEQ